MNKANLVEQILEKLFGRLYGWRAPTYVRSPGPQDPRILELFDNNRKHFIDRVRNDLISLSYEELTEISKEVSDKNFVAGKAQNKLIKAYQSAFETLKIPVWWAGGFGTELRCAEFQYWAQMNTWDPEQATALSIGFDPKYSNINPKERDLLNIIPYNFYIRRRSLIENRFYSDADSIMHKLPTPLQFCEWAISVKLDVLPELFNAVGKITGTAFELHQLPSTKRPIIDTLEPRERESLLKMVIGLAIGGYSYNPDAQRSKTPKEIRDDLNKLGLDLH